MYKPQLEKLLTITALLVILTTICTEECELDSHELPLFYSMTTRRPIQLELNVPKLIECYVDCYDNHGRLLDLSNCGITHDWVLRLPYRNIDYERISRVSDQNRNATIDGLSISFEFEDSDSMCTGGQSNFPFSITLVMHRYSQDLKHISVICGIERPNVHPRHDIINIATLKGISDKTANIYSADIDSNPSKEGKENGNVSFTCTRSVDDTLFSSPLWQLTSSDKQLSNLILNESTTIYLNNNSDLVVYLEEGDPYFDSRSKEVQDFNITFENLSSNLPNMTLWCGVEIEDGHVEFYNRSATVTISEQEFIVYSNDTDRLRLLTLQTGHDEQIITCTKREGYLRDVRVVLLDDNGTISDSQELKFSTDKDMLSKLGVTLSESVNVGISWQKFDILLRNLTSNMTVACGARDNDNSHLTFYNYIVVTVIKSQLCPDLDPPTTISCLSDPMIISGISSLSIVAVIAIVTTIVTIVIAINRIRMLRAAEGPPVMFDNEMNDIQGIVRERMVRQHEVPDAWLRQNINLRQDLRQGVVQIQMPEQNFHDHPLHNRDHQAQLIARGIQPEQMLGPSGLVIPNLQLQEGALLRNRLPVELNIHLARSNSSP